MLKVAYLIEADPYTHLGVIKKVCSQIEGLVHQGAYVKVFCISPKKAINSDTFEYFNAFDTKVENGFISQVKRYINRILSFKVAYERINDYCPDVIYLREGVYYPGLSKIIKKYPTVLEVNHVLGNIEKSKSPMLSYFFHYLRGLTFKHIDAVVAISNEVQRSLNPTLKSTVISNGLSAIYHHSTNSNISNNSDIKIIMVGSPGQPWQGFDELINFAKSCVLSYPRFKFYIAGPAKSELGSIPHNVNLLGFLDKKDLDGVLMTANIGIGTLAGYRKGINEVSSLKHRAYGEYGIPFITSVYDTDFSGLAGVLSLENKESSLINNREDVINFIEEYHNKRILKLDLLKITEKEKSESRYLLLKSVAKFGKS
ncbi:glycosyltransferase family protein [Pseudoalteromonas prydzensis]|uniref:hypothetical protein n=1 Tax=Pseudoalteromonas prydzensis TaxID=182141 RepID=UPI0007E51860|nr:hypothetical protein [Pseudoalteromonas prydzensis]MBE0376691.1 hypothetical protein [Pseudoalteromonas prydzensis ACAM 620]